MAVYSQLKASMCLEARAEKREVLKGDLGGFINGGEKRTQYYRINKEPKRRKNVWNRSSAGRPGF